MVCEVSPLAGDGFSPVRTGCRGSPAASKPPFSFSEEKENAPFDGVREKGSGGGIPGFARNARSALYGGFGLVMADGLDHSTTYDVSLAGGGSGCSALLFCCRTLAVWDGLALGTLPDALAVAGAWRRSIITFLSRGGGSCDCRSAARLRKGKGARGKPLVSHGSFAHWAKEPAVIIFPAACTSEKYPDPCAPGAHTPVTDVTGEGESKGGTPVPSLISCRSPATLW